jgi:phosphatidate phosphatase LPIN
MKIGEAGEAFFVFETEEDVPEDLITSPLLEATRPEDTQAGDADVRMDRSSAKQDVDGVDLEKEVMQASQEPDFLDLNASPGPQETSFPSQSMTPPHPQHSRNISGISLSKPAQSLPSPPPSLPSSPSSLLARTASPAKRTDEAVSSLLEQVNEPKVDYKQGESIFSSCMFIP